MATSLTTNRVRFVYGTLKNAYNSIRCFKSDTARSTNRSDQPGVLRSFKLQVLPELYPTVRQKSAKESSDEARVKTLIRDETLLIRNTLINPCINRASSSNSSSPTKLALIDGPRGVGKSTLLSQTVAYARERGFIVLFIPDTRTWTDGPGFFCPNIKSGSDPILDGPSAVCHFNRPKQMQYIFNNLLHAHGETLAQMPCSMDYTPNTTTRCQSLKDLALLGKECIDTIDNNWQTMPTMAADVLHQLVLELSNSPDAPFALVIDDYHFLIGLTCMVNDRKRRLHANSIRAIAQLFGRSAIEEFALKIRNGFVALATEDNPCVMKWRRSRVIGVSDFPLSEDILDDPNGRVWLKRFRMRAADPSDTRTLHISVPEFIPGQLKAICATFASKGLGGDHTNPEQRLTSDRLVALAGGRGSEMARIFSVR